MKQCPACRSQYTDDTLQFCLQDGTPLSHLIADSEIDTVVSTRDPQRQMRRRPAIEPEVLAAPSRRPQRTGLIVLVTALTTMLLFGIIAAGYFIASRSKRQNTASVNVNVARNDTNITNTRPSPTQTVSPTPASANSPAEPSPDPEEVSREITKAIAGWESDTESLDMDALIGRYANTVNYYRNGMASRETVKRDKDRAFAMYDSADIEISNIRITPGKTPDTAIAEFDKAWVFEGESRSEGKVRSRLSLRKSGGRWLINGEQDIRVY